MKNTLIPALIGLLACTLPATTVHAVTVLAPGAVWEYTFTDPTGDPAWNTTTGGWVTGPAPFGNVFDGDFGYSTGTLWPADGDLDDDLWVRTSVDLTGYDLTTVLYDLGADNGFKLYANGGLVDSDNAEGYTFRWEYGGDIPAGLLGAGVNVIAVALEDHGGLTAFDMQITASSTGVADGGSTLPLLAGVLGTLGWFKRRFR